MQLWHHHENQLSQMQIKQKASVACKQRERAVTRRRLTVEGASVQHALYAYLRSFFGGFWICFPCFIFFFRPSPDDIKQLLTAAHNAVNEPRGQRMQQS